MYLWKSNICSHRLDVQEANVSVSQFHRIGNYFRWMLVCEWAEFLLLICGLRRKKRDTRRITRNRQPRKLLETEADSRRQLEIACTCLIPS